MNKMLCVGMRLFGLISGEEANQNRISLFDVKALYDIAYAEKAKVRACLKTFRAELRKAEVLDAAYRRQLMADRQRAHGRAV